MSILGVVLLLVNGADTRRKKNAELCRTPPTLKSVSCIAQCHNAHFISIVDVAREKGTLIGPW